jgi:hypothetical protein
MTSVEEIENKIKECTAVLQKHDCLDAKGNAKHYKSILTLPLTGEQLEEVNEAKKERALLLDKLCSKKAHKRKMDSIQPDAKRIAATPYPALQPLPMYPPSRRALHLESAVIRFSSSPLVTSASSKVLSACTAELSASSLATVNSLSTPASLQTPVCSVSSSASTSSSVALQMLASAASTMSSLPASASSSLPVSSAPLRIKVDYSRCKWCGEEGCSVCSKMQGSFTDAIFLHYTSVIAAHLRDQKYSAPSYVKMNMTFYDVCKKAEAEGATVFSYNTGEHELMLKSPCEYCGAAPAGRVACVEQGNYVMPNMLPLCIICERLKGVLSDRVFTAKCKEIDAHRRRCQCNAPRFFDTGMCASAYLNKKCDMSK